MTYSSTILADNPIAYYHLDETVNLSVSGTTVANSGTAGGNAVISINGGHITSSAGAGTIGGSSFHFDNNGGFLSQTPTFASTANLAIEFWYKWDTAYGTKPPVALEIANFGGNGHYVNFSLGATQNQILVQVGGTYVINKVITGVNPTDGNWHHIVITQSGAAMTVYIDAVSVATYASTSQTANTNANIQFGAITTSGGDCYIDEPAAYSTALTLAQVQAHYAAGTAAPSTAVTVTPPVINMGTLTEVAPSVAIISHDVTAAVPAMTASLTTAAPVVTGGKNTTTAATAIQVSMDVAAAAVTGSAVATAIADRGQKETSGFSTTIALTGTQAALFKFPTQAGWPTTSTLSFTQTSVTAGRTLNVYRINQNWTESDGTVPTYDSTSIASYTIPATSSSAQTFSFDVTSAAQLWADGTPNYGLAVVYSGAASSIYTHEYTNAAFTPKLETVYGTRPPQVVTVSAPVMTLSLTDPAPVTIAQKNVSSTATIVDLGTVDLVAATNAVTTNAVTVAPVMMVALTFPGGVPLNPDVLRIATPIAMGITAPGVNQFIEYNTVTEAPAMYFGNMENEPVTINLTTNRLTAVPPMVLNLKWPGIYIEAADRYLTLLQTTVDPDDIWYKLNENDGSTRAIDNISGTGIWQQSGYYFGHPTVCSDGPQLRKGTHFDGASDYLVVGPYGQDNKYHSVNDVDWFGDQDITIEFSIRTSQTDGVVFAGVGAQSYARFAASPSASVTDLPKLSGYEVRVENGELVLVQGTALKTRVRQQIADGQWHHVVISIPSSKREVTPDAIPGSIGKFDNETPSFVAIDGKPVLVRYNILGYGGSWLPYSFMARAVPKQDFNPSNPNNSGLNPVASTTVDGFLAGDLRDVVVRLNGYIQRSMATQLYYEWSNSIIVKAEPMTVSLAGVAPFKVKGNQKRMLAIYGLEYGFDDEGLPIDTFYSTLFDFLIENIDPMTGVHGSSSALRRDTSVLHSSYFQTPKTFKVGPYIVYPVAIMGDPLNATENPASVDGIIDPGTSRDFQGYYVDDSTGMPRFINLQTDLAEDVTEFDALTVVNYPWGKPNIAEPDDYYASWGPATPDNGMLNQGSRGLSDIEWSEARDALRDSILEAAYDGVSLWIGEWHMAQHFGFIHDVDFHETGWWPAGGTDPGTGLLQKAPHNPNVAGQELDRLHLDETGSVSNNNYYQTGTKKKPSAGGSGLPAKYLGQWSNGGTYFNWIYSAGGGAYWSEPQINHYRRVVAELPGMTDLPTTEYANIVSGWSWDAWKPNGIFYAWDLLKRPNGLQVGDYSWMDIVQTKETGTDANLGLSFSASGSSIKNDLRSVIISARPDGIIGQVITRETDFYYGRDGIKIDNPFKNNAYTIAVEAGTIVRGRPLAGRVFIELMDKGPALDYLSEDIDKSMWQGTKGKNASTWDFDSRRAMEQMSSSAVSVKIKGDFVHQRAMFETAYQYTMTFQDLPQSYWARVNWHARGVNWLAQAPVLEPGEVINYPGPITLQLSEPNAVVAMTKNPIVQVNGAMTLFLEERQPANYRDGSVVEYAMPMAMSVSISGIGSAFNVKPITLSLGLTSPTLDVEKETIAVYLDNARSITLYLKEEN